MQKDSSRIFSCPECRADIPGERVLRPELDFDLATFERRFSCPRCFCIVRFRLGAGTSLLSVPQAPVVYFDGRPIAALLGALKVSSPQERATLVRGAQSNSRARWMFRTPEVLDALVPMLGQRISPRRILALPFAKISDGEERSGPENYWHTATRNVLFLDDPPPAELAQTLRSCTDPVFFDAVKRWVIVRRDAKLRNLGRIDLQVECELPVVQDPLSRRNLLADIRLLLGLEEIAFDPV